MPRCLPHLRVCWTRTVTELNEVSRDLGPQQRRQLLERILSQQSKQAGPSDNVRRQVPPVLGEHAFAEYVNPYLAKVLRGLKLDKRFVRGEGCWLFDSDGRKYLDFMAGYGAVPFGHNPPEIWEAIHQSEAAMTANLVQP